MVLGREALEEMLSEGRSLEEIGRRVGRHPSTVSYWLDKYGLDAAHRLRHLNRGGLAREVLVELVAADYTVREIAREVERSVTTVRYWLRVHELETTTAARRKRAAVTSGHHEPGICPRHGETTFVVRGSRRICVGCRAEAVTKRRQVVKRILVEEFGGACQACGYADCVAALQFHHLDPATKSFGLGSRGLARAIERVREEARKCVLVCANCHAEIEAGFRVVGD